jgi:hypothetical protein
MSATSADPDAWRMAATWSFIDGLASADRLKLDRSPLRVTILTTDSRPTPLVTITIGDLTTEDADPVLRCASVAALEALRALPR